MVVGMTYQGGDNSNSEGRITHLLISAGSCPSSTQTGQYTLRPVVCRNG